MKIPSVVYFIECKDFIKIGRCRKHNFGKYAEQNNRISELQGGNPFPLTVLGYIELPSEPEARAKEKSIQGNFNHLLHKNEWFRKSAELLNYIKSHANEY